MVNLFWLTPPGNAFDHPGRLGTADLTYDVQ